MTNIFDHISDALPALISAIEIMVIVLGDLSLRAEAWPYFYPLLGLAAFAGFLSWLSPYYLSWRRSWLSRMAQDVINQSVRKRWQIVPSLRKILEINFRRSIRYQSFRALEAGNKYVTRTFWLDLKTFFLPSFASFLAIVAVLTLVFLLPHPPQSWWSIFDPAAWWRNVRSDLKNEDATSRILEGLIAIIIALIVFVAESIRGSSDSDQKRVLLSLSNLWVLAALVTLVPLGFLWNSKATGLSAMLAIAIALLTIYSFAQVVNNLLNAGAYQKSERHFLRSRVRDLVMDSASARIGNRILFDKLGPEKEIKIELVLSRFGLPDGPTKYRYINAPQSGGVIQDINLEELKSLADYLQLRLPVASTPKAAAVTAEVAQAEAPAAQGSRIVAYLFMRYREAVPEQTIFSRGTPLLALPKAVVSEAVFREVTLRIPHIFRFSRDVTPSNAFRREMQSTKDRLIAAIRDRSKGLVDDLQKTFLMVAEEFLETINQLGGSYSAEQAIKERSTPFGEWTEVRWLVSDLREFVVAASDTEDKEIISTILYLPFMIAARAIRAGDHLLFQEFMSFSRLIYSLANTRRDSAIREFMIDRAWRFAKETTEINVERLLIDGDADE